MTAADILHLDMDCFFAAVEVLEDPSLVGRPVVVGGIGPRGVVASASYEARAYGVRSAMPTGEARRLCPRAVFLPPRHGVYSSISDQLMEILRETTPLVEPMSLDEAYLDVAGAHRLLGGTEAIARRLREQVRDQLRLACSVGGGRTKLVAKLASRAAKPEVPAPGSSPVASSGVFIVRPEDELEFLDRHYVRAIPGIGPRTAESLARIGIEKVGELRAIPLERLVHRFGQHRGRALVELASGNDSRRVEPDRQTRSIGQEGTFDVDVDDEDKLKSTIRRQATTVARRCRESGVLGRTVTLKVRYGDFTTLTRSKSERSPYVSASAIARAAESLFDALQTRQGVRLIGVSVSSLEPEDVHGRQLALFGDESDSVRATDERHVEVELATDAIRRRFGPSAIGPIVRDEVRPFG